MQDISATQSARLFWVLVAFLLLLWVAGGASFANVLGQSVVRFAAWVSILAVALIAPLPEWHRIRVPIALLGSAALLMALQLVPLPPSVWTALPGRDVIASAPMFADGAQPWRPLSLSPDGTLNALESLVVPAVVLVLSAYLQPRAHWRLAQFLLLLVLAGCAMAAFQLTGASLENPLLNSASGMNVRGNFANRNHFALFVSVGCVLVLIWGFQARARGRRNVLVALAALVFFVVVLLGIGSRMGLVLGIIAIVGAVIINKREIARQLARLSPIVSMLTLLLAAGSISAAVWLSLTFERAEAVERALLVEGAAGLRFRIWSVSADMALRYFPFGSGFGTFDPTFRMTEPNSMLNPKYFNHAHNDFLEIVLEGGLLGLALILVACAWFVRRSIAIWRKGQGSDTESKILARAGSIIIFLVAVASIPDYPARTPMIMAVLALAAVWMGGFQARGPTETRE